MSPGITEDGRYSSQPQEGQAAWVSIIRSLAVMNIEFFDNCVPGYYNHEGSIATEGGGLRGNLLVPMRSTHFLRLGAMELEW